MSQGRRCCAIHEAIDSPEPTFTLAQVEAHVEKLAGLVKGMMGCQEVSDDFNVWLFTSPTGDLVDRDEVFDLIRTTSIGEESA